MLKIGDAANRLGISKSTLRTWTDRGFINAVVTPTGHRLYAEEEVERVANSSSDLVDSGELLSNIMNYMNLIKGVLNEKQGDYNGMCAVYAQQISHQIYRLDLETKKVLLLLFGEPNVERFNNIDFPLVDDDIAYIQNLGSDAFISYVQNQLS